MDAILVDTLAVTLCAADMSCTYIAVNPVLDNRDELIEKQYTLYKTLLNNVEHILTPEFVGVENKALDQLWYSAIKLTAADIVCKFISLDPISYDRTEKVNERIIFHFERLRNYFPTSNSAMKQTPSLGVSPEPQLGNNYRHISTMKKKRHLKGTHNKKNKYKNIP